MPRLLSWENDERLIHLSKNDYGPNSFHDRPYDIYILPDSNAKEGCCNHEEKFKQKDTEISPTLEANAVPTQFAPTSTTSIAQKK